MSAAQQQEMICISCPIGCRLTVSREAGSDEIVVQGNKCGRGKVYGEEEFLAPRRMVTCTCSTDSEIFPRVPVRTVSALPKELIDDLLSDLYRLTIPLPIKRGQSVLEDFRGTGIDVIATMSIAERNIAERSIVGTG
jgi:CxxC motif-containing protein